MWAHVRIAGPGNAFDPRYVAWARARFDAETTELLTRDAALIGRMWREPLHAWSELHPAIADFMATAGRPLGELAAADVAQPRTLSTLQALDGPVAELVHASLGLLAPAMVAVHRDVIAPSLRARIPEVVDALAIAADVCPGLDARRVELCWPLGPRGRAFPSRIVVGAPADWNGQSAWTTAALALHEYTVAASGTSDYVASEWEALTTNARRLARRSGSLATAYGAWLARLDLDGLLPAAVRCGWLSADEADALRADPAGRLTRLAVRAR